MERYFTIDESKVMDITNRVAIMFPLLGGTIHRAIGGAIAGAMSVLNQDPIEREVVEEGEVPLSPVLEVPE